MKTRSSPFCIFCGISVPQEEQSVLIVELHRRLLELYGQIASFVLPEESASDAFIVTFLTALRKLWAHAHPPPPPLQEGNPTDNFTVLFSSFLLSFTSAMETKSTFPATFFPAAHHRLSTASTTSQFVLGFCKS